MLVGSDNWSLPWLKCIKKGTGGWMVNDQVNHP